MDNNKNMGIENFIKQTYLAKESPTPSPDWKNKLIREIYNAEQEYCLAETAAVNYEVKIWRFAWLSFAASAAATLIVAGTIYFSNGSSHLDDPAINVMNKISMLKDY
ncbi:MAG: hypothetical protein GY750_13960 [Lentisphaerae bacterium]|nr:hypothetical protein [Lentisphaerota bacterium]MCP4102505.1 hypothetical protein [Lentisphaerota bacterium]